MHTLMAGLVGSGKSSFIAALWEVLTSGDILTAALQLKSLSGQSEHLNRLHENWLEVNELPRTLLPDQQFPEMTLRHQPTGVESTIMIPDLSGEVFRDALVNRTWSVDIDNLVLNSQGIVFFIHSTNIRRHVPIDEAQSAREGGPAPILGLPPESSTWEPEMVPTQVNLLDMLQMILLRKGTEPVQLAVVASAWDLAEDLHTNPRQWLEDELPLLHQFLKNNTQQLNWEAYGVSAQGGEIPKDVKKLRGFSNPTERIKVVGPNGESHDITEPIQWSMFGEPRRP